ncbi:MAG: TIGR02449 family protein [Pseudomonadota bacterium]
MSAAIRSELPSHNGKDRMSDNELNSLESKINELIDACTRLKEENLTLRSSQEDLVTERASLIEKTELARNRVEAMISRLKSLEENT